MLDNIQALFYVYGSIYVQLEQAWSSQVLAGLSEVLHVIGDAAHVVRRLALLAIPIHIGRCVVVGRCIDTGRRVEMHVGRKEDRRIGVMISQLKGEDK